ncbi:poly(ADP-ribose) glycohydrolase isoform X3 [Folsomia candida]|uniref:poly(ADP-ribose) glycohydrolase isoform X3 n=1 Tax=Folsomia candida TaxID=158441 RepID=UPI000B906E5C|nr:poly(ADP-ribose) glycohydrolase isoform X3 [Folsomia candida]
MSTILKTEGISESSLYYKVDQDLRNLNSPVQLGFEPIAHQTVQQLGTVRPFPSPTPASQITAQGNYQGLLQGPTVPSTSTAIAQFRTQISPDLRDLEQKYSTSIICLFPHESSSEQLESDFGTGNRHWVGGNFVRLPHNPANTAIPTLANNHQRHLDSVKKWDIIKGELAMLNKFISEKKLDMSQAGNQIHASVRKFNSKVNDFSFNLLNDRRVSSSLQTAFPIISRAALEIDKRFTSGIPILRKNQQKTLFLTQGQIRCILANAFLCTFPKRFELVGQELPEINFFKLFDGGARGNSKPKLEKISGGNPPDWTISKEQMSMVHVDHRNRIEDARESLQIDFANRLVGGGVTGNGALMEEIRFSICPELIAARLFTEALESNEVMIITGCQQFSLYSGCADTFAFKGTFCNDPRDPVVLDPFGRRKGQIAVMDACYFRANEAERQFEKEFVHRELNKCFCAFKLRSQQNHVSPIATGNWGCGNYNGSPELKFIIQWMAASQAGQRALHYYVMGNKEQGEDILRTVKSLGRKGVRVGTLCEALKCYYLTEIKSPSFFKSPKSLFQFLEKHFK